MKESIERDGKMSDRVYRYGCRKPRQERLALQLLGQASNYREDLRHVYNDALARETAQFGAAAHVRAWEDHHALTFCAGHVIAHRRVSIRESLSESRNAGIRSVRSKRGHLLDCGTYWLIESAMLQAAKMAEDDRIAREPWDETGRIGAAIQATAQFPVGSWLHPRVKMTGHRSVRKDGHDVELATLSIQVGALKDGIVIDWPIKLHRPLPADGTIKQVAVQRTRVGHRFRWEALITVEADFSREDPAAEGAVGLDVGWRDDGALGRRVCTHDAVDDSDVLRIDTLDAFVYADGVRGTRDECFTACCAYAQEHGVAGAEHAKTWRDKSRMHGLASRASDLGLAWWVQVDRHLEDIECGVRATAMRRRLDAYRRYVDALAKRYRIVALEDMPMADWVGEGETAKRERHRSVAALYTLQGAIAHRFGAARVDWVPAAYTTMTCAACGVVRRERVGAASHWTCACGADHHQDHNAAEIIRLDSERWCGAGNPPRARSRKAKEKTETKAQKRARVRAEKATAREPLAEVAE